MQILRVVKGTVSVDNFSGDQYFILEVNFERICTIVFINTFIKNQRLKNLHKFLK